jgi:hypothetical protein
MQMLDPTKCGIGPGVTKAELEAIALNKEIRTVQFSVPLNNSGIDSLERIVLARRPDIELRVFGHYSSTCDLSFLERTPSVRRLSADCLMNAVGIDAITNLRNLDELSIGIYSLDNFDFLAGIPSTLTKLGLHLTFSKKPSIAAIERFSDLRYLYLEGQKKGIESVSNLSNLEKIVLRSISTSDISYLTALPKLWSVDVKLGGIKDFSALSTLKLKYLELWFVRGLSDLSFISSIESLQFLFLQSLKQVEALPSLKDLSQLRRIYLEDLKGLEDFDSLEFAPGLTEFVYAAAINKKPEDLAPVLKNPSVKSVGCWFGSDRKNKAFEELAKTFGKAKYDYSAFEFR